MHLLALLLFSLSAFAAPPENPAVRVTSGPLPITDANGNRTEGKVEVTVVLSDAKQADNLASAVATTVNGEQKKDPSAPVMVVAVGEGLTPALQAANPAATAVAGIASTIAGATHVSQQAPAPASASLGQKLAASIKGAALFYGTQVRPRLPIAPAADSDTTAGAVSLMIVKGLIAGGSSATILFVLKDNVTYTTQYVLAGLSLTMVQSAMAMATAFRNTELLTWIKDRGWWNATGTIDDSRFSGIKSTTKLFALTSICFSLTNLAAGMLALKPSLFDPVTIFSGALLNTVVNKDWYALMARNLPKDSPWKARLPVILFAVSNLASFAAIMQGVWNPFSLAIWGGLAGSGFVTRKVLDSKEAISAFFSSGTSGGSCPWRRFRS